MRGDRAGLGLVGVITVFLMLCVIAYIGRGLQTEFREQCKKQGGDWVWTFGSGQLCFKPGTVIMRER